MTIKHVWISLLCAGAGLLVLLVLAQGAHAQECKLLDPKAGCSDEDGWDPMAKLDEIGNKEAQQAPSAAPTKWPSVSREKRWNMPVNGFNDSGASSAEIDSAEANSSEASEASTASSEPKETVLTSAPKESKAGSKPQDAEIARSSSALRMLAPVSDASYYDVLLDASDGVTKYADGAVHIDYLNFTTNNTLKRVPELASLLADAGISQDDSVLIYGECKPCGGGPSAATYAYWVLKYLGHEKVKLMDGTIRDWAAANGTVVTEPSSRPAASYEPAPNTDLLATYDYVKGGEAQIVDARTFQEFGAGSVPGAINIPYDSVISSSGRIKDEAALKKIFTGLSKGKPVVVYTNTGVKASMIWFALEMLGYDARIYSWMDWMEHQKEGSKS